MRKVFLGFIVVPLFAITIGGCSSAPEEIPYESEVPVASILAEPSSPSPSPTVVEDEKTKKEAKDLAARILKEKMTAAEATTLVEENKWPVRIVEINGETLVVTTDYLANRFNFRIEGPPNKEIVIGITFG